MHRTPHVLKQQTTVLGMVHAISSTERAWREPREIAMHANANKASSKTAMAPLKQFSGVARLARKEILAPPSSLLRVSVFLPSCWLAVPLECFSVWAHRNYPVLSVLV
jgi:hypothetical protein